MKRYSLCLFLCFLVCATALQAQDTTRRAMPLIESMLEEAGEDRLGASIFLDEMEYYSSPSPGSAPNAAQDPVRILSSSPLIGNAPSSRYDSIAWDDPVRRREIAPFMFGSEERGSLLGSARITFRSTIENSFAETRGMREQKWSGSPVHSVQRLKISAGPYAAGLLLEHDEGELFRNGLAVGYVSVNDIGMLRQGMAGMFTVNAGEGLVLARSSIFSKGTISITQTKKYGAVLVPYLSRDEFHYFRGAAASLGTDAWSVTAFGSHRRLPATVDETGAVTSFFTSGLFRTENEIRKIGAVAERSAGVVASAEPVPGTFLSLAGAAAAYDRTLAASPPYAWDGGTMRSAGFSFSMTPSPVSLFGEIAGHDLRSLSGVIGTIYRAAPNFAFAVHLRSFSDRYNNPFARAFGERGCVNGERGIYFGFDWNVSKMFGLFSYVDHFRITDPTLFTKQGVEYLLRADGITAKNFTYSAQLKYKTRSVLVTPDGAAAQILDDHRQATLRFTLRYTSPERYTLTQRINVTRVSYGIAPQKEKGMLAATDIAKQYASYGIGIKAGVVFFDTDSYDSGLSIYEPDVRGAASTSMLFGKGMRMFAMADYAPSRRVLFSLKYSILSKWNVETLGSGDDELLGNSDPELTVQAEITL